jgi:protein phosphatase
MPITIPHLSLIVLVGPSGSGKSTFAHRHFLPTEVLSSDACRGMVGDDQNDQNMTEPAFEVLHFIARKRLALGKLTVIDATNVQPEARKPLVQLAREYHCLPIALVFNLPERICEERNRTRTDRGFPRHVIRQQKATLRRSLRGLKREGFSHVFIYDTPEEVEATSIERTPLWNDTGCVFGGKLTALRWPEREFVSVPAGRVYCEPARPFLPAQVQPPALTSQHLSGQQLQDDLLEAEDVLGKRLISTRLRSNVTIREDNSVAALEAMSRFAANPKWLIYLPPTMSPCETSEREGFLEFPTEAFSHYRENGVAKVVCEEKHMGSRAVVVICRDEPAALERFGVAGESGIVYTRTGRRFFSEPLRETQVLARLRSALEASGFWSQLNTNWACLDCELMPWSAKAQELLRSQYAAVGAAGRAALPKAVDALQLAVDRLAAGGPSGGSTYSSDATEILRRFQDRGKAVEKFVGAYRQYCWPVASVDDLKLAPFHLLATEGKVHVDKSHAWHMETLAAICRHDPALLVETPLRIVDLASPEDEKAAVDWWLELTRRGGEGMVVKPHEFIATGPKGLVQPAVKCRGREYLRIIYGPEYTFPENLVRLRKRGLGAKRSLALREFALGVEALERFVDREPLRRVHECVFGVLALESEPVDPRL